MIGVTNYDDGGRVTKAKDLHTTEPVWVVDMGVDDVEITEKNLATSVKALYENAKTSGVPRGLLRAVRAIRNWAPFHPIL